AEGIEITAVSIDAVAGLASRWIAGRANHRFSVDAPPRGSSKPWRTIGPIVRDSRGVAPDPAVARSELGLDPDKPVLLVTGGSQGARSVNDFVERFLRDGAAALEGWQVLHQSGGPETTDARLTAAYQDTGIEARVTPFVEDMPLAWAAAEFSICRGGASTVAEIRWHRTPSAILPYPHHRDQHQRYNAEPLRDAGGVLLLRDHIDPEANMSAHAGALASVLGDPSARATMRSAIAKLGPCDGAGVIAGVLCGPR
ncbi:MAG: UDP-N-acetylglucosamine--N-acetylmuramyl-(pentapeptide) pyrophosphoryl-undecaprenol N-acetylglucosamine transferase, partial [Planctomycetota bacterium]